ncbi:MAG: cyclase family protein [Gemmatimonadetes bacterium]|nr:cyclase family protein [Gemmatimonadota bacterium]
MRSFRQGALAVTAGCVAWLGCEKRGPDAQAIIGALFSGASAEWIDMSHPFDATTIYWPTSQPFQLQVVAAGMTPAGFYYAANNFCTAEHGGTHLDAPIHFAEGRHTADRIPVDQFVGPAVVVDVSARTEGDPDYRVTVADLEVWESRNGRIPDGAIVLFRTGWGRYWPDRARYLGTTLTGEAAVPELHFPGLHPDAARWLAAERKIDAVGIDTPSIDFGQSVRFESHQILFAANIPAFENVASLDRLPETGAYVVALPMKIGGGTGGPLRMVGIVPRSSGARAQTAGGAG